MKEEARKESAAEVLVGMLVPNDERAAVIVRILQQVYLTAGLGGILRKIVEDTSNPFDDYMLDVFEALLGVRRARKE